MRIDELISELEDVKKEHGNLEIATSDYRGNLSKTEVVTDPVKYIVIHGSNSPVVD